MVEVFLGMFLDFFLVCVEVGKNGCGKLKSALICSAPLIILLFVSFAVVEI